MTAAQDPQDQNEPTQKNDPPSGEGPTAAQEATETPTGGGGYIIDKEKSSVTRVRVGDKVLEVNGDPVDLTDDEAESVNQIDGVELTQA